MHSYMLFLCDIAFPFIFNNINFPFVSGDYVLLDGNKGILQRLSHDEDK